MQTDLKHNANILNGISTLYFYYHDFADYCIVYANVLMDS